MRKRTVMAGVMVLCTLFLWGCSGVEPEKREYPQVVAVDRVAGENMVIFGMPNMQEATGQEESGGEEDSSANLTFTGKNMEEIKGIYNDTQEKYLDTGHVNVLLLGERLIEQGYWEQLLGAIRQDVSFGEDIYVFVTEDIEKVMKYNGSETDALGDYLIGIYENRPYNEKRTGVTLRQVYKTWYETGELCDLPRLVISKDDYLQLVE